MQSIVLSFTDRYCPSPKGHLCPIKPRHCIEWITKEQIKAVGRIVSLIKSQLSKPVVQIKEIIIKMNANGLPMAVPIPPPATAPMAAATSSFPSYRKTAQVELTQNQKDQLKAQGYTDGLIDIITKSVSYFPHRVWVVDNSGSKCK